MMIEKEEKAKKKRVNSEEMFAQQMETDAKVKFRSEHAFAVLNGFKFIIAWEKSFLWERSL